MKSPNPRRLMGRCSITVCLTVWEDGSRDELDIAKLELSNDSSSSDVWVDGLRDVWGRRWR